MIDQPSRHSSRDPREAPAYTTVEAARYLQIPVNTLRAWAFGRDFPTSRGVTHARPLVTAADPTRSLLSFINLLELHVLAAVRRRHQIDMRKVRSATRYLERAMGHAHPRIEAAMETNGTDLFVTHLGQLVNVSREGQVALGEFLRLHLQRIERDSRGLAVRLFPFTRHLSSDVDVSAPRVIAIDPLVAFGRPVLATTRIPTVEIAERYKAGDSIDSLSNDYGRAAFEIEEAIRCELRLDAA